MSFADWGSDSSGRLSKKPSEFIFEFVRLSMLRQLEKCGALKELHDASAGYAAMKNCSTAVQSQLLLTFSLALISKMDFLITPRQRLTILSPLPRLAWRVAR
ncbi:MAG: hypothetical protein ACI831_000652, partial [Candidatus Azotimanducaceae bacterium]